MLEKLSIEYLIDRERDRDFSLVVLMCGIAGSGKTTLSQNLEKHGYVRLSIDEEVWSIMVDMELIILSKNIGNTWTKRI